MSGGNEGAEVFALRSKRGYARAHATRWGGCRGAPTGRQRRTLTDHARAGPPGATPHGPRAAGTGQPVTGLRAIDDKTACYAMAPTGADNRQYLQNESPFNGTVGLSLSHVLLESVSEDGQAAPTSRAITGRPRPTSRERLPSLRRHWARAIRTSRMSLMISDCCTSPEARVQCGAPVPASPGHTGKCFRAGAP